jgi:hypothetical protein
VSCPAPGNCAAAGFRQRPLFGSQAAVASQVHGRWRDAEQVPGTAKLIEAELTAVSCPSPGTCAGAGDARAAAGQQPFVVNEAAGRWRAARQVHAPPDNACPSWEITQLSCSSAGNCAAVGDYQNTAGSQVFVIDETGGRWGSARQVPGSASLNADGNATITALSCARGGGCAAAGSYKDSAGRTQPFVVTGGP